MPVVARGAAAHVLAYVAASNLQNPTEANGHPDYPPDTALGFLPNLADIPLVLVDPGDPKTRPSTSSAMRPLAAGAGGRRCSPSALLRSRTCSADESRWQVRSCVIPRWQSAAGYRLRFAPGGVRRAVA